MRPTTSTASAMRLPPRTVLLALLACAAALLFTACGERGSGASGGSAGASAGRDGGKPSVVATTPVVADLVRAIAGDRVEVAALIAPGVDPHLWSPTRTEVLEILEADAVFLSGLLLEGRAGEAFARVEVSGRPVVRLAETLPKADLLTDEENPSRFDPHVWMDPLLWARTAPAVRDALVKVDPAGKEAFDGNLAAFEESARALDRECALILSGIPQSARVLVTAHDAFNYFGKRYGLEVRGIQGISTESEPALAAIEALVAEMSERRVPALFAESTVSNRSVLAVIEGCKAREHEVVLGDTLFSDSLGRAGTPEGTWRGMMLHNARSIARALGGGA